MTPDLQDFAAYNPKLRIVSDNWPKWRDGVAALAVSKLDGINYTVANNMTLAPAEHMRIVVTSGVEVEGGRGYAITAEVVPRAGEKLGVKPSLYQNQFVVHGPELSIPGHPKISVLNLSYKLCDAHHSISMLTGTQKNPEGITLCSLESIAGCTRQEEEDTAKAVLSVFLKALETTLDSLYRSDSTLCSGSTQPLSPNHQRLGAAGAMDLQSMN